MIRLTARQYTPSGRAADISRLLDPSYTSSSCSSSLSSASPVSAYVDHAGDLHDPDYRDFPEFPRPHAKRAGAHHHKHHGGNSHRRSGASPTRIAGMRRPAWERYEDDEDDEDAFSGIEAADFFSAPRFRTSSPFPFCPSFDVVEYADEESEKPHVALQQESAPEQDVQTPSCLETLRVQMKTLSFRVQYGLFRAKRRLRERRRSRG